MKANELMLGDWVMDLSPCVIDAVSAEDICTYRNADGYITANPRNLKPVPLTPEILLKNGFVNDFYEDVSVADYHTVRVEGYTYNGKKEVEGWDDCLITCCNGQVDVVTDFHGEVHKEIMYVHELQHCLKLVGLKKDIVL